MNDYRLTSPKAVVRMKSLMSSEDGAIAIAAGSLFVAENMTLNSRLDLQSRLSNLAVGGDVFIKRQGRILFWGGLAIDPDTLFPAPRFVGKTLDIDSFASLGLYWFSGQPIAMLGGDVPYIRLSGSATFGDWTSVRIYCRGDADDLLLFPGEYLLLTADDGIKGRLPTLEIVGGPMAAKTKLKFSSDRRKLILEVMYEKPTALVFVGSPPLDARVFNGMDPKAWSGGRLPNETDDVIISRSYLNEGNAEVVRFKSLATVPTAGGIIFKESSLYVSGNVVLKTGFNMEFQSRAAKLAVGGSLSLDQGCLAFIHGLGVRESGELTPRFLANQLKLGDGSTIRLRWFKGVPKELPGNTVPYVRITEDVIFSQDNVVEVRFENKSGSAKLLSGEYLLLTAGGTIKGPLPKLDVRGLEPGSNTKNELKLSPDNRQLLLVVTEVK
jgi:hypothetical protein